MNIRLFKRGFTLVELLIVITIIGILAVALLPTVLGSQGKARDTAKKTDVSALVQAIEQYNIDNGAYPTGYGCSSTQDDKVFEGLKKYMKNGTIPEPLKKIVDIDGATCDGYVYCQMADKYNYFVGVNLESQGMGPGYFKPGTLNNTACSSTTGTSDQFTKASGGNNGTGDQMLYGVKQ